MKASNANKLSLIFPEYILRYNFTRLSSPDLLKKAYVCRIYTKLVVLDKMKFQAYNRNRCQGLSLRLDITEIDPRGNMVKYGPEIEAATCFENNSLEFKSEMLFQFTEILLGHDFDCLHDADRHDRVDFSIISRLDLIMENMRN